MIAAVSADFSATTEPDTKAATEPQHWLTGIYFVPSPDLSDETRWAINQGRSMPLWEGLMSILHHLERKGATDEIRAAARAGRIEHMGVNGIAKVIHLDPKTVLRQLRHLEKVVGIVATDQRDFTLETDPATGRIVRNYARAEPKSITMAIKPHHLRPAKAIQATRTGTPGTTLKAKGGTGRTPLNPEKLQGRNACVPKETNLQRGSFPSETNRRTSSAGPLGRPAASSAKSTHQRPPDRIVNRPPPAPRPDRMVCSPATPQAAPAREEQEWERKAREDRMRAFISNAALVLECTEDTIKEIGRHDRDELMRRLTLAGCNYGSHEQTFRRMAHPRFAFSWELKSRMAEQAAPETVFDARKSVVDAISINREPQEASTPSAEQEEADEAKQAWRALLDRRIEAERQAKAEQAKREEEEWERHRRRHEERQLAAAQAPPPSREGGL